VIPVEIPSGVSVREVGETDLPRSWRTTPAPPALQELGTRWASAGLTAVLSVPSVVVPRERNYVLNPAHPDFRLIRPGSPEPFVFDPRVWK
jgi:RES domain-containing protein